MSTGGLDSVFHSLGTRGRFIKLQLLVFLVGEIPIAIQLLSNVFIGLPNAHRCAAGDNQTELSLIQSLSNLTTNANVSVTYDQCNIHVVYGDSVLRTEPCLYGMDYNLPKDSSFISQFDLVCNKQHLASLSQTLLIVGQAIGAFGGSILADRYGRKPVVIGSNIGLLLCGMGIAFSPCYEIFAALKFLIGIPQQAKLTALVTWMLELFVIKDRRLSAIFSGLFWTFAVVMMDVIAYGLKDYSWRVIQVAFSCTSIVALLEIVLMKESFRWSLANRRTNDAVNYIRVAGKFNGLKEEDIEKTIDLVNPQLSINVEEGEECDEYENKEVLETGDLKAADGKSTAMASGRKSYVDLLKKPRHLMTSLIIWAAWMVAALGFFAIYLTATTLAGNGYLNFFLMAIMEIPPNLCFYFSLNKYGRRTVMMIVYCAMSIGLIASGIFRSLEQNTVNKWFSIVTSMFGMFGAAGAYHLVFIYTPEIFPTNIRNQTVGIGSMMSRIGGMLAPFAGILSEVYTWAPGVVIGTTAAIVAILMKFMPETSGKELPQTVEEFLENERKNRTRYKVVEEKKPMA